MKESDFLRSAAVFQIISRRPGFVERWGLLVILVSLLVLSLASSFIKYSYITKVVCRVDTVFNRVSPVSSGRDARLVFIRNGLYSITNGQTVYLKSHKLNSKGTPYFSSIVKSVKLKTDNSLIVIVKLPDDLVLYPSKTELLSKNQSIVVLIIIHQTLMQFLCHALLKGMNVHKEFSAPV